MFIELYDFIRNHPHQIGSITLLLTYVITYTILYTRGTFQAVEDYSLITNIIFVGGVGILFLYTTISIYRPDDISTTPWKTFLRYTKYTSISLVILGILSLLVFILLYIPSISPTLTFLLNIFLWIIILIGAGYFFASLLERITAFRMIREKGLYDLFYHLVMLIPCALYDTIDHLKKGIKETPKWMYYTLLFQISFFLLYFIVPRVWRQWYQHGAMVLLEKPRYLNYLHTLTNHDDLEAFTKTSGNFYQYGLSGWFYINNQAPKEGNLMIFNYGGKPRLEYNIETHTLSFITFLNPDSHPNEPTKDKKDSKSSYRILYQTQNVPLQKWNHVVINYSHGTMDLFLNNELVSSSIEVSPYKSYDDLEVGEERGLEGGVSDVLFYSKPISRFSIWTLYTMSPISK